MKPEELLPLIALFAILIGSLIHSMMMVSTLLDRNQELLGALRASSERMHEMLTLMTRQTEFAEERARDLKLAIERGGRLTQNEPEQPQ